MIFTIQISDEEAGGVRILITRSNEPLDLDNPPLSALLADRVVTLLDVYGADSEDIDMGSARIN